MAEFVFDEAVLQAVEGDDAQSAAGRQTVEDGVQPFVEGVQLRVDRNAHRLKGSARGVFGFAAFRRGYGACHNVCQLQGGFNGCCLAGGHDLAGNLPGVGFLAVVAQDAGQLLTAEGVDQIRGGGALLAHTHIQRRVGMVRKAALRVVQLVAGNAQVQQSPVDRRDVQFRQDTRRLAEIHLHDLCRKTL